MILAPSKIIIDSDLWEDVGKVYNVVQIDYTENSSRVDITFDTGEKRVVSKFWIREVK